MPADPTELFEHHRPALINLAYGMLGRVAPAEDAVQEAYLRWQKQDAGKIQSPEAYLTTIVSRICLDELKSAKNRKQEYIGPDLPEPVITTNIGTPESKYEKQESVSIALLVVLEELTPIQRAVFLLHDVFDYEFATIAGILNKSSSYCRKTAQRARERVRDKEPHYGRKPSGSEELVSTFLQAVENQEPEEIKRYLADEAVLYSDGGGKVTAARKPVTGAHHIAKFLVGIRNTPVARTSDWTAKPAQVNNGPGMIVRLKGRIYSVWAFQVDEGQIRQIYAVLNPDKLRHLEQEQSSFRK